MIIQGIYIRAIKFYRFIIDSLIFHYKFAIIINLKECRAQLPKILNSFLDRS